jgi:hypothetical protein
MDRETQFALNDILDAVEELAKLVRELNPGAENQLAFVDFLLARTDRLLVAAKQSYEARRQ